jgi:manganese/zinc/iron transport system substrate-binding protein
MLQKTNKNFSLFFLLLMIFMCGCSDSHQQRHSDTQRWMQSRDKIKVLSTTAMIHDLVKQVGGEYIDSLILIQNGLDPHSYQLVKGDDEKLGMAQIVFYNGLGLEHGPSLQQYLHNHPKAVALGDFIYTQNSSQIIYVEQQKDPHIWMDISLWSLTIPLIVRTLSEEDPAHATEYQENGHKLLEIMTNTHQEIKKIMSQVPASKRYLVTSHDAFNYFARAYLSEEGEIETNTWEKRFAAPEGLAPESQLSVVNIKEIIAHLKKYQIQLIFPESNVNRDSIKKIVQASKEQGIDVAIACCPLYGDAMGLPGTEGDTYLKMITYNAHTLAEHMQIGFKGHEK